MWSDRFAQFKLNAYWRSGIALALSVLLHFLIFKGMGISWPWPASEAETDVITAELLMPAVPPPTMSSKPAKQSEKLPSPMRPMSKPPESKPSESKPSELKPRAIPPVPAQAAVAETDPPTADSRAELPVPQTESAADTDAANSVAAENSNSVLPEDKPPPPPDYVAMEYEVNRGDASSTIATTQVVYQKTDETYRLHSETKAKGLASLFLSGSLVQISTGKVTDQGLQPLSFAYEFGSSASKHQYADFDWNAGQLTMHTSKEDKTAVLTAGTQDLLSFMYQYMFVPPLNRMELSVTNGKKLSHYVYTFEGEESVNTKLGNMRTLHIAKRKGESEEKTELWLAIDYHYLPVKIRKTEKDGKLYEQTVTRLSTEQGQ